MPRPDRCDTDMQLFKETVKALANAPHDIAAWLCRSLPSESRFPPSQRAHRHQLCFGKLHLFGTRNLNQRRTNVRDKM